MENIYGRNELAVETRRIEFDLKITTFVVY